MFQSCQIRYKIPLHHTLYCLTSHFSSLFTLFCWCCIFYILIIGVFVISYNEQLLFCTQTASVCGICNFPVGIPRAPCISLIFSDWQACKEDGLICQWSKMSSGCFGCHYCRYSYQGSVSALHSHSCFNFIWCTCDGGASSQEQNKNRCFSVHPCWCITSCTGHPQP